MLNGKPFFPIMVNNELGPENYHCQLRKPDGTSWGFNMINLMTEVTWHFKKFGGYCPDNPDLDYCGSGYRIRDIISGDANTSPQYHELLSPMGYDIDWYSNANRIFNYLDNDMYILSDDYAFYPSTVDWFEQNSGCSYYNCIADCDSIYPPINQETRNQSIDRVDSLARLINSKLVGFYGLDDPTMLHTKYNKQTEANYFARFPQQSQDLYDTYLYSKSRYPNSVIMYNMDILYYPKAMNPSNPSWQNWNTVLNNWVTDEKNIIKCSDVTITVFYDASHWSQDWWLYPNEDKAMWYPEHLEQTLFPRVVNTSDHPAAVIGGLVFDDPNLAPNPPFLDAKAKWATYIGLQKGVTGLYFFGWHKGNESLIFRVIWNSIKQMVDTIANVKHLDTTVFTKTNVGPVGHSLLGTTNQNISYAAYQSDGWNDYYLLVTNNPNGSINEPIEPDNVITLRSSVVDFRKSSIEEVFSGNPVTAANDGAINYAFPCWGVALFHVKSNSSNNNNIPSLYYLNQNYPNPFNPSTQIDYGVHDNSFVSIKVYNSLGQQVASLVNSFMPAGNYSVQFYASSFSSGIYYYKMKAGNFEESKKLVLLK